MALRSLSRAVQRSVAGVVAVNLAINGRAAWRQWSGRARKASGWKHARMRVEDSVAYIDRNWAHYAAAFPDGMHGRVAEVGPGDNCGLALRMIEAGAERVDMLDKFFVPRPSERNAALNAALIDRSPRLRTMMARPTQADEELPHITRHHGASAAAETFFDNHRGYDAIVSQAVLEHLRDVPRAIAGMAAALAPGGRMFHLVDLRDHGMFTAHGHDELAFFTVPAGLYTAMTAARGFPNRVPVGVYREALAATGLTFDIRPYRLVGEREHSTPQRWSEIDPDRRARAIAEVERRREGFARELRSQPAEDLAVTGFNIHAQRAT